MAETLPFSPLGGTLLGPVARCGHGHVVVTPTGRPGCNQWPK